MDIIAWNIWKGGGSRLTNIGVELIKRNPEIIVLGEYVLGTTEPLIAHLEAEGWIYKVDSRAPRKAGWGSNRLQKST